MATDTLELEMQIGSQKYANAAAGLAAFSKRWDVAIGSLTPIARREMINVLDTIMEASRRRHSTRWRPDQSLPTGDQKGKLAVRSGRGLTGLRKKVKVTGDEVTGTINVPFPLSIHEDGARVRKSGKMLAIPLPAALNSRGLPIKKSPRMWDNTYVAKSRNGNLLIFRRMGRQVVPLYVLRDDTKIPRRLGLGATMEKAAPLYVERVFKKALEALQQQVGV